MSTPYLDAGIIIRFLTGDDPEKQRAAQSLFEQVENGIVTLAVPDTVIADAVYVLHSKRLYGLSKSTVAELLTPLVSLPGLRFTNRRALLTALRLYGEYPRLDFADALLVALAQSAEPGVIYSFDTDYDGLAGIVRREPEG